LRASVPSFQDRFSADFITNIVESEFSVHTRTKNELREVTARRIQVNGPAIELRHDSTDPRYGETPIRLRLDQGLDQDSEIAIGGVVVAVYRPLT
jgi:hypothetical protein